MESGGLNGLLTLPVVLTLSGALAALIVASLILVRRRGEAIVTLVGVVLLVAAAALLAERAGVLERAAGRRAVIDRVAALDRTTLVPGSPLACLNSDAGDTVEDACEKAVFASAQSAATAVAYMAARLRLLADAATFSDPNTTAALAASRRAVELDRYGLAAQVLAAREGCTAERCAAFALVNDANALKANLKARVFEQYASRYADAWNAPAGKPAAVSSLPPPAAPPAVAAAPPSGHHPVSDKYDFPSAASIPPVSIMNAEPSLPAGADAPPKAAAAPPAAAPIPPKRPVEPAPAR